MFNGVRVSLEGNVASVKEQQKRRSDSLARRIARAEHQISDAAERGRSDPGPPEAAAAWQSPMMDVPVVTHKGHGAIGVDLNAGHLAVCETYASGNYVNAFSIPVVTYGKSQHQAEAIIGDAAVSAVEYAREVGKTIVIEKLDFRGKKAALESESRRYSRILSSLSYGKIKAYFLSRGYPQGVEVHQVNPAFSSMIGRVKFMERYGPSVHQAAAVVLARRLLGCSERIPRRRVCPVGNGRPGRLHHTREEASEARMDILGCGCGTAETSACSAAPAGEAETRPQSSIRFRLPCGAMLLWWLEWGSARCSLVRFQGGVAEQLGLRCGSDRAFWNG